MNKALAVTTSLVSAIQRIEAEQPHPQAGVGRIAQPAPEPIDACRCCFTCRVPVPRLPPHPAPHPSRYPLRYADRWDPRGRSRGWMLVDGPLYRQEQARCGIDTENGTRSPEPGAPLAAPAPPDAPTQLSPRRKPGPRAA